MRRILAVTAMVAAVALATIGTANAKPKLTQEQRDAQRAAKELCHEQLSSLHGADGQTFDKVSECDRYVNQGGTVATTAVAWDPGTFTLVGIGFTPNTLLGIYVIEDGNVLGPPFPFLISDGAGHFQQVLGPPPPGLCGPQWVVAVTDGEHTGSAPILCPT